MNTQRLEMLATYLENWKPSWRIKFDMNHWVFRPMAFWRRTRMCAVGLAATHIPQFQAEGLTARTYLGPYFNGYRGFAAVEAFFDLDYYEARTLFSPGMYPTLENTTPKQVAERIRYRIEQHKRHDEYAVGALRRLLAASVRQPQPQPEETLA